MRKTVSGQSTPSTVSVSRLTQHYETMPDGSESCGDNGMAVSPCCQNKRIFGGNVYHATPSAPTLEININQHNPSPVPSCYNQSASHSPVFPQHHHPAPANNRRPPPTCSPPAPPALEGTYAKPVYNGTTTGNSAATNGLQKKESSGKASAVRKMSQCLNNSEGLRCVARFFKPENRIMLRLCVVELLLAAIMMAGGVWCVKKVSNYCPYHSGIWTSAFFLVNALLGIAASGFATVNFYVAHLVLSLISVVINWNLIGTYHHPKLSRDHAFCLLGEHDASRISYIFSHMDQYDFKKCLFELKIGIAVNSVQLILTVVLALLFAVSATLCMKRICTRCRGV
ncbi:CD20-like family domain-containing protein [Ditylenchus destructor]|uniref:CD20-like family domain-containing protein n=1 Tax=Ditylenchus destructor TaxID=166010 RepID=A0AAD4MSG1_9BILA|nr:CD20-like family domain-containing protein [Ditylenchus destructor]